MSGTDIYDHVVNVSFSLVTDNDVPEEDASQLPLLLASMKIRHDRLVSESKQKKNQSAVFNESFEISDTIETSVAETEFYLKQHDIKEMTGNYVSPEILLHCTVAVDLIKNQLLDANRGLKSILQLLYAQSEGNEELRQSIASLANSLTEKAKEAGSVEENLRDKLHATEKFLEG